MRSCIHCECWIPVHCDTTIERDRNGKVRNPGSLKALWRNRESNHMQGWLLETRYAINVTKVRNCSLCEPRWSWWEFATGYQRLAFDILYIVITSICWHLTFRNCYHGRRKDFFQGGTFADISIGKHKKFPEGAKSDEISCFSLETKKTTFFAKSITEKCEIWNSRGALAPLPPLPTTMIITLHSNLNLRPQNAAPGGRCPPLPPGYATVLKTES